MRNRVVARISFSPAINHSRLIRSNSISSGRSCTDPIFPHSTFSMNSRHLFGFRTLVRRVSLGALRSQWLSADSTVVTWIAIIVTEDYFARAYATALPCPVRKSRNSLTDFVSYDGVIFFFMFLIFFLIHEVKPIRQRARACEKCNNLTFCYADRSRRFIIRETAKPNTQAK